MCGECVFGCRAGRHGASGRLIPGWCSVGTTNGGGGGEPYPDVPAALTGCPCTALCPAAFSSPEAWGGLGERGRPQGPVCIQSSVFSGCWRCSGTSTTCLLSVGLGDVAAGEGDVQCQGFLLMKQLAWFWTRSAWLLLREFRSLHSALCSLLLTVN